MLELSDLPEMAALFMEGFGIGALLSCIPFMLGYVIAWITKLIKGA